MRSVMRIVARVGHALAALGMLAAAAALAQDGGGDPLVRDIQRGLEELGYDIRVVDGLYGPNTRAAIESFQGDHELPITGEASRELRERIARLLFQRSRDARRMWRKSRLYLKALGYAPGEGGFEAPAARRALQAFAADHHLTLDSAFSEMLHGIIVRRTRSDEGAQTRLCRRFMQAKAYARAFTWCRRAARKAHVDAQYYVGWMYYYGRGVDRAYDRAFRWLHRAAEGGDSRAQTFVGLMYRYGRGVARDPDAAQQWYRRAVE